MAKMNISELKNPLRANSVNLFNPMDWISSIVFVAWFGMIVALGAKTLNKVDSVIPGNNTPNQYKAAVAQEVVSSGYTVL